MSMTTLEFMNRIELWLSDGKSVLRDLTRDGQKRGTYVLWHECGRMLLEGEWMNGKPEGSTKAWYPSGKRMLETTLHLGTLHGKWKMWDENGRLLSSARFEHGLKVESRMPAEMNSLNIDLACMR